MEELTKALGQFALSLAALTHSTDARERNELAVGVAEDLYHVLNAHALLIANEVKAKTEDG